MSLTTHDQLQQPSTSHHISDHVVVLYSITLSTITFINHYDILLEAVIHKYTY